MTWQRMEDAPKCGKEIIGLYEEGAECDIFWSKNPVCILGSRNYYFQEGWATCGGDTDYNLPMDAPIKWRP